MPKEKGDEAGIENTASPGTTQPSTPVSLPQPEEDILVDSIGSSLETQDIEISSVLTPELDYKSKKEVDSQEFLAKTWTYLAALVILAPLIFLFFTSSNPELRLTQVEKYYNLVLGPVMTITGSITGYYFGKSSK